MPFKVRGLLLHSMGLDTADGRLLSAGPTVFAWAAVLHFLLKHGKLATPAKVISRDKRSCMGCPGPRGPLATV